MTWQEALQPLYPVLASALVSVLVLLIRAAQRWIEGKISSDKHAKAAGIVMDAVLAAVQEIGPEWAAALADGKLSPDERLKLKTKAKEIALSRLAKLRGFALDESMTWLEHQLDISLGKLTAGLFGLPADGTMIGPDDPAQ